MAHQYSPCPADKCPQKIDNQSGSATRDGAISLYGSDRVEDLIDPHSTFSSLARKKKVVCACDDISLFSRKLETSRLKSI